VPHELLRRGGPRARRPRRPRRRQPRALLRPRRLGRRRAARPRRGRLRRGAPARGERVVVARRPRLRRLALDVGRACREAERPLPARPLDRVERAGERLVRAVAPAAGRRRLRELPPEAGLVLIDALGDLAAALHGEGEELEALSRRALSVAGDVEACLDTATLERVVWSEPDAVAWAPVDVAGELRE